MKIDKNSIIFKLHQQRQKIFFEIISNCEENIKIIKKNNEEIQLIKSSKFWKLRNFYMKIKNLFC